MGVCLVYLGKDDKGMEMHDMCETIAEKLRKARVEVQETNFADGKNLPQANSVTQDEVWFGGHSRFVEKNMSIRPSSERTLGGFPIKDIAIFVKDCVSKGKKTFRFICCESAQQQRYKPIQVGAAPDDLSTVLGKEFLESLSPQHLRLFAVNRKLDPRVSHLEELILEMAELWKNEKNQNQPAFKICGLWGAGDVTDNLPITSFLQAMGGLEAAHNLNKQLHAKTFDNAHCANQNLPDFFGYSIRENLLVKWAQKQWEICLVEFDCNKKKANQKTANDLPVRVKLPKFHGKPETVWRLLQTYADKPTCPTHNTADCMQGNLVVTPIVNPGFSGTKQLDVKYYYDTQGKIRNVDRI